MQTTSLTLRKQHGAILIITLVMLVLLTLIIVSSVRSTTMEEKMAGNSRDRDKALQAAEAVVQQCLNMVNSGTFSGTVLTPVTTSASPHWETTWTSANSYALNMPNAGLANDPRCMVEALGTAGSYRITGRAVGASDDSVVMLQATYSTE